MSIYWKDIIGYEGRYQVSSTGIIKGYDKVVTNHMGSGIRKGVIMKLNICKGYLRVSLRKYNKSKSLYVQRIVAETFIINTENKKEVNHINGNKLDNRIENLEWVTPRENMLHAYSTGLKVGMKGIVNPKSIQVIDTKTGIIYESTQDAADKNGIKRRTLSRKLSGERNNNTTFIIYKNENSSICK